MLLASQGDHRIDAVSSRPIVPALRAGEYRFGKRNCIATTLDAS
jgi:hypothetical protein